MVSINISCPVGKPYPYPPIPPKNITANFSFPGVREPIPEWEIAVKSSFYALAFVMTLVGNLLVIVTVANSKNMRTTTFYYIVNLAISDLLIGLLMWIHLFEDINHEFPFAAWVCKGFPFVQILALTASTMFLTAIAVDRFFSIVYPWRTFSQAGQRWKHVLTITVIWIISAAVASPMIMYRSLIEYEWKDYNQAWCDESWPRYFTPVPPGYNETFCPYNMPGRVIYYSLSVILMYIIPVVVMIIAYSIIYCSLHKRKIPGEPSKRNKDSEEKTRKKVVLMLLVVFIAFLVCWTPQEVIVLYNAYSPTGATSNLSDGFKYAAIYIAYFNSALNPILYAWLNKKFRQGFKDVIRCGKGNNRVAISPTHPINGTQQKSATHLFNTDSKHSKNGLAHCIKHTPNGTPNGTTTATNSDSSAKDGGVMNTTHARPGTIAIIEVNSSFSKDVSEIITIVSPVEKDPESGKDPRPSPLVHVPVEESVGDTVQLVSDRESSQTPRVKRTSKL